jgi:hypothetical protein
LLDAQIDCASDVCTSLLVDRRLDGALRAWALGFVAALAAAWDKSAA